MRHPADLLRAVARQARHPVTIHGVDILEIDVSGDPDERFPKLDPPAGVTTQVFEDLADAALTRALPPDRLRLLPERRRRGDVFVVVFVDGEPAGWVALARQSHRDPWSGLRVRLASDEIYAYDLWVHAHYRRSGAARYLAQETLRYAAADPVPKVILCWTDEDNVASQTLMRKVLGLTQVQKARYARVFDRFGVPVPFSDRPRFGPFSRRGRHRR
ncbi:MAG TPA: GNAT family N-acetyltransferase [Thermoleophilaceae bacterium]|nr:GNAT family N-acetyltransferase [Thermoleophilaceae bacterium]